MSEINYTAEQLSTDPEVVGIARAVEVFESLPQDVRAKVLKYLRTRYEAHTRGNSHG